MIVREECGVKHVTLWVHFLAGALRDERVQSDPSAFTHHECTWWRTSLLWWQVFQYIPQALLMLNPKEEREEGRGCFYVPWNTQTPHLGRGGSPTFGWLIMDQLFFFFFFPFLPLWGFSWHNLSCIKKITAASNRWITGTLGHWTPSEFLRWAMCVCCSAYGTYSCLILRWGLQRNTSHILFLLFIY